MPVAAATRSSSLLKEAGEHPTPDARDRGRARAHARRAITPAPTQLLDLADKLPAVERWKLDRERGRLALRQPQFPEAVGRPDARARELRSATPRRSCSRPTRPAPPRQARSPTKVKQLAPTRLKGRPEATIVEGKLLVAADKDAEAEAAFKRAKEALEAEKASRRAGSRRPTSASP